MSIKKLFDSTNKDLNYQDYKTEKEAFESVESKENAAQLFKKKDTFVPSIDYSDPINFAFFGSAELYYSGSFEKISGYYPYDGSDAESNEFYNSLFEIDKYIFDKLYPRSTGYATLCSDGWTSRSGNKEDGYGLPATLEYITFKGGPNTGSAGSTLINQSPNQYSDAFNYGNIYDTNIYETAGLPDDYGKGTRLSNLRSNFDDGVTVEFWLKSGSLDATLTEKQVIFDMWNNEVTGSGVGVVNNDYGRITILLDKDYTDKVSFVVQSGSVSKTRNIGVAARPANDVWQHYALAFYNTGSTFKAKLYVNGDLNDTWTNSVVVPELNSKNMMGRLGALLTSPSGSTAVAGAGKLSGSIDEFRFWKVARNAKQIGENWFGQVGGGANSDISNTTLGLYYKFNEGITTNTSIDSIVLDYGGRVSNGVWTGYNTTSRNTGSAILSASAAIKEHEDPIIRTANPAYSSLRTSLLSSGSFHDINNTSMFMNYAPEWVLAEHEDTGNDNLKIISHIVGAYFDKLYVLTQQVPGLRHHAYTTASADPVPFAQHLPQSLGLYSPDIFVEASILEALDSRDEDSFFEGDLQHTRDQIYQNLYNNLAHIFKAKGTEKAMRNVLRCFNLDDTLIRFRTYAKNTTYEIKNNLRQTIEEDKYLNFNTTNNLGAVTYQRENPSNSQTTGFISGSKTLNYEKPYGFTAESNILFPKYFSVADPITRNYSSASLFGIYEVDDSRSVSLAGTKTTILSTDNANFQVHAVRPAPNSKDVRFILSSSVHCFAQELTSSTFPNVYADSKWNLSVRLKPSKGYPISGIPAGSDDYSYDLIFRGTNSYLGSVQNSFEVSASVTNTIGAGFLTNPKRCYVGAHRTNVTGALLQKSDVLFSDFKYWLKYLENSTLDHHSSDYNNSGILNASQNISGFFTGSIGNLDLLNLNTLALEWSFDDVTGSDGSGQFYVLDYSSGSSLVRNNYGWVGQNAGYQHSGFSENFEVSSTTVALSKRINNFTTLTPEEAVSSTMIEILSEDDTLYDIVETVPNYVFTLEKSMYQAISEEMMDYMAGVADFNNVLGEPVNRYRTRYKNLEKLREAFFRRVTDIKTVEKFLGYYKWFDAGLSQVLAQLMPASADFVPELYNVVESHVLERPKYETKFPTLESNPAEPDSGVSGWQEINYPGSLGGSTVPQSPRDTTKHIPFWKKRALRSSTEITSGDATIDAQRETYRKVINSVPHLSSSQRIISTFSNTRYTHDDYASRAFAKTYNLEVQNPETTVIKGGVNFESAKNIDYTYAALRPAGPVNTAGGVYIPTNVLLSFVKDFAQLPVNNDPPKNPAKKVKRTVKVLHGRDYDDGVGYQNVKSTMAFPFNIISASVAGGYSDKIDRKLVGNIEITNLHNDVYGPDMEVPMQGPFTDYAVGGHQSRHVELNDGPTLDNYLTRPEAWKILLGCVPHPSGAIGMVSPDYPYPEANAIGFPAYPMTGAQKAYLYRDFVAKRPVNIRNIQHKTGSTILGNYNQQYEILMTNGAFSNPRHFVDNQPSLPSQVFQGTTTSPTSVRTFLDLRRATNNHFEFVSEYSTGYLTGTNNQSVIRGTFAAPGGMDTMTLGYEDFRAAEYSVYNALPFRNLGVLGHSQPSNVSQSQIVGSSPVQSRVSDIHGKDYGLRPLLSRHASRFFRDSLFVTNPGASYNQLPAFHRTHRNHESRLELSSITLSDIYSGSSLNNAGGYTFVDTDANSGSTLLLTGTTALDPIRNAITSSGFTWTGWVNFGDPTPPNRENVWAIGNYNGEPLCQFTRTKGGSSNKFAVWLRTTNGLSIYGWLLYETPFLTASIDTWNHYSVTWNAPANTTLGTISEVANAATIYLNGISQSVNITLPTTFGGGAYSYVSQSQATTKANFKDFSHHDIDGNDFMVIGGGLSNSTYEFSGSIDEFTFWKKELNSTEIAEIYNAGVPCDITASAVYAASSSQIWDWLRFEASGGTSQIDIDSANPGTYETDNRVSGYFGSHFIPLCIDGEVNYSTQATSVPAGCTPVFVRTDEVKTYTTGALYDNAFVSHQIPRSTQQYAWITGNVINDNNIYGYTPADFYISDSAGYREAFTWVASGSFGSYLDGSGNRKYGRDNLDSSYPSTGFLANPFLPLNINIRQHLTKSTNIIGIPNSADSIEYVNSEFAATNTARNFRPTLLNSLLITRNGPYGYASWQQLRNADNPILSLERKDNIISIASDDRQSITRYDMPPVSMRGRPIYINIYAQIGAQQVQNTTFKAAYNNEGIYFNTNELSNRFDIDLNSYTTAFDQLVEVSKNPKYTLNWILYSENIFPSQRNEFITRTSDRTGYDNNFWRSSRVNRRLNSQTNTWNMTDLGGIYWISASMFALDAPYDFLTRTHPPHFCNVTASEAVINAQSRRNILVSGAAGELQNTYTSYATSSYYSGSMGSKTDKFALGSLYARKQTIGSPWSVASRTGIVIPATGSGDFNNALSESTAIEIFGGEAVWQAGSLAGIVEVQNKTASFVSYPSEPWFDTYSSFRYQLKTVAKDFGIVPEFRISEHIKEFAQGGILNPAKTDNFEIPGTSKNSTSSSFYRDYSNTEFLQNFAKIKNQSNLDPKEIELVVTAAVRFNPYEGFYPAQRTLQLVNDFVDTYSPNLRLVMGSGIVAENDPSAGTYSVVRNIANIISSPGILYNSIKSGIAVDYPIQNSDSRISASVFGEQDWRNSNWAMVTAYTSSLEKFAQTLSGATWDVRAPFETIIYPEKYLNGIAVYDNESNPSASFNLLAAGDLYSRISKNFFGGVADFFLKDSQFTKLESATVPNDLKFIAGETYMARVKILRSTSGSRDYSAEKVTGTGPGRFGQFGAQPYYSSTRTYAPGPVYYPLPQDPQRAPAFKETFTMYSRPTAFGPPIAGCNPLETTSSLTGTSGLYVSNTIYDSFMGYNPAYTPPYTDGEAWADLIFRPSASVAYDLERIMSEISVEYWRFDPGPIMGGKTQYIFDQIISGAASTTQTSASAAPYSGRIINANSMQLNASVNLFGVERIQLTEKDKFGNKILDRNTTAGSKWVIQPKFETPMLNFNDDTTGINPLSSSMIDSPVYASASVPRGMWHQFGVIPKDPNTGVFLEIGDVPREWLRYHYNVINTGSIYNNFAAESDTREAIWENVKSLSSLMGFDKVTSSRRLGELKESLTVKEAIVAVPYILTEVRNDNVADAQTSTTAKSFITIPKERFNAALNSAVGSKEGDSLESAGASIRDQVQKMQTYIMPPEFNFIENTSIDPVAMYIFEFSYTFDKDDLSYMWQNLAPRNYKQISFQSDSVTHTLANNELISQKNLINNPNLRWMVFKVKQKSQADYFDYVATQRGQASKELFGKTGDLTPASDITKTKEDQYLQYNWPYDYLSFVELIKMDAEVLFNADTPDDTGKKKKDKPGGNKEDTQQNSVMANLK